MAALVVWGVGWWREKVLRVEGNSALEKGMDTHSSILAWRIPWTEESGGLQSMGSQRVRHKYLNAEFQRIARRDKKAFFSDQCKEIEENNRMVFMK